MGIEPDLKASNVQTQFKEKRAERTPNGGWREGAFAEFNFSRGTKKKTKQADRFPYLVLIFDSHVSISERKNPPTKATILLFIFVARFEFDINYTGIVELLHRHVSLADFYL